MVFGVLCHIWIELGHTLTFHRPDNCDGTYEQFCDTSREYSNITDILQAQGRTALLSDMNTYWKDYKGNDETFWEHEWNKHGSLLHLIVSSAWYR